MLILANCVVFLYELTLSPLQLELFFRVFGVVPARFTHPEWAMLFGLPLGDYSSLVTSMFLHGGWLHIFSNMWSLWIFGDNVEDRMGPVRFLIFYLLCGLAAGIVHILTNPDSTIPTVGASGAIAGVMGAYLVLFPYAQIIVMILIFIFPFFFEAPAPLFIGLWAFSQLFSGVLLAVASPRDVGGIAWWAHVGGFVAGMMLQFIFVQRAQNYRPLSRDEYGLEAAWAPTSHGRRNG
jgi:membrane associated rhomboid family serine protease